MIKIKPRIKIELEDGTGTWITVVEIHQTDSLGAQLAAGEAFALFLRGLVRDAAHVNLHLKATRDA